ncbi:carboxylic acid reductase [Novosphingobium sp. JCM 18896]|uniref:carboxylic acid reductase n=1 Tax=Novosphingobium sp. JCM 18896 TaxID=2989731 RepID=UPI0022239C46|nr:carboxylic acid reductase [Novosphingobium sp. JCM 18896]MCW1431083.1 thioester reductase domain-containing protein [Novosphingobium sp. JCM 18896]
MTTATAEAPQKTAIFTGGAQTDWAKTRLEKLMAEDRQFIGALPDPAVVEAKRQPGLRLAQVVQTIFEGYGPRPAIGHRAKELVTDPVSGRTSSRLLDSFETRSFAELWADVMATAAEWHNDANNPVKAGDFGAVLGFASAGYATMQLANIHLGVVNVPLQANAPTDQHVAIIAETEPRVLAASIELIDAAVDAVLAGTVPPRLVVFDYEPRDDGQREKYEAARARLEAANCPIVVDLLQDVIARGQALPPLPAHQSEDPDPLVWLFYTSGTTGTPKGAMYTEETVRNTFLYSAEKPGITLSFMPMSHAVGYGYLYLALANGGCSYCSPKSDLSTLFDDLALVRPTMSSLVPRVCEMLYQHYLGEVDRRIAAGEAEASAQDAVKLDMRENLLGGRLLSVGCGSAVLSPEVHQFMLSMLGVHMAIGYSSTEMATATVTVDGKIQRPPVIDYRLEDVPELGYFTTDKPYPRGEFLVKIPKFMAGYYKRPDLTAEKFTADGFYKSGDVMALIGPDELAYVDRTNNVQKLSQGEFVAIARLEALYTQSPAIRQIYVYGTSERAFLLAVVVPSDELVADFAKGGEAADEVKAAIRRGLQQVAEEHGLASYEIPRDFLIEPEGFSPENGLLTGIGKFSRPNFKDRFGARLEARFAEIAQEQVDELRALRLGGADRPVIETVARAVKATLGVAESDISPQARFTDLGGDSLSALSFSMLLEEIFGLEVPVGVIINPAGDLRLVADYIDAARSGKKRPSFSTVHAADSITVHASDLKLSKFIDADLLAQAPALPKPADTVKTVLMTGATGWLGRFQALAWLERLAESGGKLILLSRGATPEQARQRVEEALDTDPALIAHFRKLAADHLEVLPGDLALESLGLDDATWERLADEVDLIVHPGAHVNHRLPYNQLFPSNVAGTAELIRLALTTRLKRLDYVSTMGVILFGAADEHGDIREIAPSAELGDGYANGYNVSKWASEVLMREAHDLAGIPIGVFRPGMILAHSRYAGQLNVPDMFTRMLFSLAVTGIAPATFYAQDLSNGRPKARYEGFAVDFLADAITGISAALPEGFRSYNLASPKPDFVAFDEFVDWMVEAGCKIERIADYDDWFRRFETALNGLPEDQRAHSLLQIIEPYRHPQHPGMGEGVPCQRFAGDAEAAGYPVAHLEAGLIHKYVADLRHVGLLK